MIKKDFGSIIANKRKVSHPFQSGMFCLYRKSQESHRGQKTVKYLAGLHFSPIY